jgi:hypothetical protein
LHRVDLVSDQPVRLLMTVFAAPASGASARHKTLLSGSLTQHRRYWTP